MLEAIEAALGAANHVIAAEGFRRGEDYADLVTVLEEEAIVETELARRIRAMARFRNLLVHRYAAIDRERVWRILTEDREDIQAFFARGFRRRMRAPSSPKQPGEVGAGGQRAGERERGEQRVHRRKGLPGERAPTRARSGS